MARGWHKAIDVGSIDVFESHTDVRIEIKPVGADKQRNPA
jgi:hypothetical protein